MEDACTTAEVASPATGSCGTCSSGANAPGAPLGTTTSSDAATARVGHAAMAAVNESLITLKAPGCSCATHDPKVQESTALRKMERNLAQLDGTVKAMADTLQSLADRLPPKPTSEPPD